MAKRLNCEEAADLSVVGPMITSSISSLPRAQHVGMFGRSKLEFKIRYHWARGQVPAVSELRLCLCPRSQGYATSPA